MPLGGELFRVSRWYMAALRPAVQWLAFHWLQTFFILHINARRQPAIVTLGAFSEHQSDILSQQSQVHDSGSSRKGSMHNFGSSAISSDIWQVVGHLVQFVGPTTVD